jgi:GH15 family glucan-1,4-alpha-glucosidase
MRKFGDRNNSWTNMRSLRISSGALFFLLTLILTCAFDSNGQAQGRPLQGNAGVGQTEEQRPGLELSRAVRPWEFVSATGARAALLGNEAGRLEAWVYPLKILRDFHLRFHLRSLDIPAEALARTITVRPESTSILYASDTFTVRETLFVPVHEAGAILQFEVDAAEPVEIEAEFQRDFQLEWPGAMAGVYSYWDANRRAFVFYDELKKFEGIIGSPTAELTSEEYWTSYASSQQSAFRLGVTNKGHETKLIVIAAAGVPVAAQAGSSAGSPKDSAGDEAEAAYRLLSTSYDRLMSESSEYYRAYLNRGVELVIPDKKLQTAYDWSRVSMIQGLVENPFLGRGLVAGYRMSGDSQRPGFAWFFGRDALWTSLALDAAGDFATTRMELDFLNKYQREDGKIPHEVSQSASLTPWFKDYPYPYASADATPLFIIVMNDYVTESGDVAYAKEKWESIWKAFEFLRSTYDSQGFAQNLGVGHGWLEGGPLLPVKTELYQGGLGLEALRALSHLALLLDKKDVSEELKREFLWKQPLLNQAFWSADKKTFAYALDQDDKRLDSTSVLTTVPMWFGLLDEAKSEATIDQLADSDQQTDWGMRIISARNPKYNPGGYHYGTVWPLFTGWAATGEYRYHREFPAFSNLRSNALLSVDGALGHVTEVLSGDYYQPTLGSSPHQIWSAAMVVNPLLRGLFGLEVDATARRLVFAPHVPANWTSFQIGNVRVGSVALNLDYARAPDSISLDVRRTGAGDCGLEFSPAISLRTQVEGAEINGRPVAFHVQPNSEDQHVTVQIPVMDGLNKLRIRLRNDFGWSLAQELPPLGGSSQGLRVVSESWTPSRDALTLAVSGMSGKEYELSIWNPGQIASVDGAQLVTDSSGLVSARVHILSGEQAGRVVFHFKSSHARSKESQH